jgi:prepilin-type N-terminal cleavage/methylation domain-containing protein
MLRTLRDRNRKEAGFTLIELMIVVLIVAILIAIGIPTFLGARTKSQERAAQVDLRQGLLTAKSFYTDNESFAGADQAATEAAYQALEPTVDFTTVGAANTDTVGVLASANDVLLVKESANGRFWCIAEIVSPAASAGTFYGVDSARPASVAECQADTDW